MCPQDNPLLKGYTVEEHLAFFDAARNASGKARDPSCYLKYAEALGLGGITLKKECTKLSGGQKRRLWIATSLLGEDTKI